MKQKSLQEVLSMGMELVKEIVAEIICKNSELLEKVAMHDKMHRIGLLKKIVYSFTSMKGKHLCRNLNSEQNSLSRHQKTKEILFKHE
jgi:hypothetical protein